MIYQYPNTNFHDLNLDWFLGQFKDLVEDWDAFKMTMEEEWDNVKNDWETLYNFVHDYFDNLDVQEEIDNKLADMLLHGELDAPIASAAGAWLVAHLATPSTPPIDNTLSVASAAADSATVGKLCVHGNARAVTSADPYLVDADNAVVNQVYMIQQENIVANLPSDTISKGTLMTYNYEPGHNDGNIQIFVTGESNFEICYRVKWGVGGWRSWKHTRMLSIEGSGVGTVSSSNPLINDADTVAPESIYTISEANFVANLPADSTTVGTLMTYSFRKNIEGGVVQIFVDSKSCIYHRLAWGSPVAWRPWQLTSNNYQIKGSGIGMVTSGNPLINDADNAGVNTVYVISEEGVVANLPAGAYFRGNLMTYSFNNDNQGGALQIFVDLSNNMYYRLRWGIPGTWFDWVWVNSPRLNLSMFETMAVIGDSFSNGTSQISGVLTSNQAKSWPQIIARDHGINCINFTKSGLTCRTWQTDSAGLAAMLADTTPREIYFIALGINDYSASIPIGDITDASTSPHPDTFIGNLQEIRDQIIAHDPNALICWLTILKSQSGYNTYSDAIVALANYNQDILLDFRKDPFIHERFYAADMVGGHPVIYSYAMLANVIEKKLTMAIQGNAKAKEFI